MTATEPSRCDLDITASNKDTTFLRRLHSVNKNFCSLNLANSDDSESDNDSSDSGESTDYAESVFTDVNSNPINLVKVVQ